MGDEQEFIGWKKKQRANRAEWIILKKIHGVVNVHGALEEKWISDRFKDQDICRRREGSDYLLALYAMLKSLGLSL